MPTISMFYGIVIYMFFYDDKKHKLPHIHASFGDDDAIFSIEEGEIIEGTLPRTNGSWLRHGLKYTKMTL